MNKVLPIVLSLGLATLGGCRQPDSPAPELYLLDLEGRQVDPFGGSDVEATVFLFVRTDCPISNRYAPEILKLHGEFESSVRFWLVYPDPDESIPEIRAHIEEFGYPFRALRDPRHTLVRRTGARVTPEAAVFSDAERMVYRGRIDDRFVDFGKVRATATVHDLQAALQATLQGRAVEPATTRAVGCFIPSLD